MHFPNFICLVSSQSASTVYAVAWLGVPGGDDREEAADAAEEVH